MKNTISRGCGLILGAMVTATQAAGTISLVDPTPGPKQIGETVTLNLMFDFSGDPTQGGRMSVFYNDTLPAADVLTFDSFNFSFADGVSAAASQSPSEIPMGAAAPDEFRDLAFGTFNFAGLTGPGTAGSFTFTANEVGTANFSMSESGTGFFQATSPYGAQDPTFIGTSVNVVPEPEIWAVLAAGLGFMGWRANYTRARRATTRPS